ncbi:hypothetical protein I203_100408 [Kwoniella mangroviensis CBS 8507]|uniref:uncharacterized protein n=1 Tax=Kwoniella mangroviensis CBS 8507 TaxID=1296122 RepID=UPI00080CE029|nr:uncharacterized protein I203_05721 [Kwoniella mangroviensis CBS 8507]OCF64979.1 hypothetical protein I203_05721 [Kwoniella mangroviensis CBS 8507]
MSAGNRTTFLSTTRPPRSITYTSSAVGGTNEETLTVDVEPGYTGTGQWARFNLQVTSPQGQGEYMWKTSMMNSRAHTTNAQGALMWGSLEAAMAAQGIRGDLQNDVKLDVSEALSFYHAGRNPQR